MSSLYILEIKPLFNVSLANMFSNSVGSLFIKMLFSHAEAFYFDEVPCVCSFLYVPCFKGHVCEDVVAWKSEIFLPMFS